MEFHFANACSGERCSNEFLVQVFARTFSSQSASCRLNDIVLGAFQTPIDTNYFGTCFLASEREDLQLDMQMKLPTGHRQRFEVTY